MEGAGGAEGEFPRSAGDEAMGDVVTGKAAVGTSVVLVGKGIVAGVAAEFVAGFDVVDGFGPGVVGIELEAAGVAFFEAEVDAVVVGVADGGGDDADVGELGKRAECLSVTGADAAGVHLVDGAAAGRGEFVAEGAEVADLEDGIARQAALYIEVGVIEVGDGAAVWLEELDGEVGFWPGRTAP